jgi:hypothetical protein
MATRARTPSANGTGASASPAQIVIPEIEVKVIDVPIIGISPLVVNAWSHKAKEQMLAKQMKKATRTKEAKDPEANYEASRYISTDGWDGVPASGLKGCLVNACRLVDGLPMTLAKRILYVMGQGMTKDGQDLVRIHGEPRMHEGMVRLESGVADIRHRAMYEKWSMILPIRFPANTISAEQVCNLVELAGTCEGICEHRPGSPKSCTGTWGMFRIKRADD